MITDLLDLSRVEAGKLVLSFDHVALQTVVSDVIEQLLPLAIAKPCRSNSGVLTRRCSSGRIRIASARF